MTAGTSRAAFLACLLPIVLILPCRLSSAAAFSGDKKSSKIRETYALISGTVFRPPGFSLPGAAVVIIPDPEQGAAPKRKKPKKLETVSDSRGEFAIRVPASPMRYTVSVKATGFQPQEKQVQIQADERAELFFRLEPAPK